jgi:hypothetical protein
MPFYLCVESKNFLYLCRKYQDVTKWKRDLQSKLNGRVRNAKMLQRQFAAALDRCGSCCKIEKGEQRVRVEQVIVIAKLLQTDINELLAL